MGTTRTLWDVTFCMGKLIVTEQEIRMDIMGP